MPTALVLALHIPSLSKNHPSNANKTPCQMPRDIFNAYLIDYAISLFPQRVSLGTPVWCAIIKSSYVRRTGKGLRSN